MDLGKKIPLSECRRVFAVDVGLQLPFLLLSDLLQHLVEQ